jgi:hypothetical protein
MHSNRNNIDEDLLAGKSYREIKRRTGLDKSALSRHVSKHLPVILTKSAEVKEMVRAENLQNEIEKLREKASRIGDKAEADKDYRTALAGVRELTRLLDLMAKLNGQLPDQASINIIMNNPQWIQLRSSILKSLEDYPEARVKLAEVLLNAEFKS